MPLPCPFASISESLRPTPTIRRTVQAKAFTRVPLVEDPIALGYSPALSSSIANRRGTGHMKEQRASGIFGIAAKYGLIQGVLSFGIFLALTLSGLKRNWGATAVTTALLVVLMVLTHRELKKTRGGLMTYAQGLGSGTLLASIAACVQAVLVFAYVKYINTGYIATAIQAQQAALKARGLSGEQAQHAMAVTSSIMTPVGIVVVSLVTGVIGGFIVALIVSIFTQKGDQASSGGRPPG
jgi:Protein of unknown function (DUF4199)